MSLRGLKLIILIEFQHLSTMNCEEISTQCCHFQRRVLQRW